MADQKAYGTNEFFNRVNSLLQSKYSKEIVALQGDTVSLQQVKIQSLILLEVLEELRTIKTDLKSLRLQLAGVPSASDNA